MNMFARFDENPAMTLRVIKETKRYGGTDGRTDNVKTVYPLQTKFAGAMTLWVIKETKRYGRTHGQTQGRTAWKQYTPYKQSLRGYKGTIHAYTKAI